MGRSRRGTVVMKEEVESAVDLGKSATCILDNPFEHRLQGAQEGYSVKEKKEKDRQHFLRVMWLQGYYSKYDADGRVIKEDLWKKRCEVCKKVINKSRQMYGKRRKSNYCSNYCCNIAWQRRRKKEREVIKITTKYTCTLCGKILKAGKKVWCSESCRQRFYYLKKITEEKLKPYKDLHDNNLKYQKN